MASTRRCVAFATTALVSCGVVQGSQLHSSDEGVVGSDHMMLQITSSAGIKKMLQRDEPVETQDYRGGNCCKKCGPLGKAHCSPYSWNCYDTKKKKYYETCKKEPKKDPSKCCSECDTYFCSPKSGGCYDSKGPGKDYYLQCKETTTTTTTPCVGDNCPLGWPQGGGDDDVSGKGKWCEVTAPPKSWDALRTCPTGPHQLQIKVLAYNLFWWNLMERRRGENGSAGRKIAETNAPEAYDFMGFQECKDVKRIMRDARGSGLPDEYKTLSLVWEDRALGLAYRSSAWTLLADGHEDVGEDRRKQYYGRRAVLWGRFKHVTSGHKAFFINHHGPLPVSAGGACAGSATALNIMRVIAENSSPGDSVILVGDFNAQSHSSRVKTLDTYMNRVYTGNSFGGVDHIYSNCGGDAVLKTDNLGTGGSDHDALSAVIEFAGTGA